MSIVFACAMGHAPGITAWTEAASVDQRDALQTGFAALRQRLEAARPDVLVLYTSEHWANFFLDHISPTCIGRAEHYAGPVEPWLRVQRTTIPGDPALAKRLIDGCYARDVEPGFAYEMEFDHGTMVPLHHLTPRMDIPVVPIMINTLADPPLPARRMLALGRAVAEVLADETRRVGVIATGGMSHDPGEVNHGVIDSDFDHRFLRMMERGDLEALSRVTVAELAAAGAGALELLAWIALAGTLGRFTGGRFTGETHAYEAVVPWATGIGVMSFDGLQKEPA
jgi:aromatic ring-opening dioxygenase catalytic subunit (LigB family)